MGEVSHIKAFKLHLLMIKINCSLKALYFKHLKYICILERILRYTVWAYPVVIAGIVFCSWKGA